MHADTAKDHCRATIFFDGQCNLCNGLVDFVLKHDHKGHFQFCALQSQAAKQRLDLQYIQNATTLVVQTENAKELTQSTAALYIATNLGWPWKMMGVLRIIPSSVRDAAYRWVSRHRYKLFGKKSTCRMPTREEQKRFIS
jgi:predicted DCC family thiol-disulfide oxidoreductase YuxK